jgi:hypothetical protein
MTNSAIQSMRSIDRFLREVRATEKYAAEAHTEPGSVGGDTTHPVKDVDDSTEEASEGSRSAENTADVKADQGEPAVDNTPENIAAKKAVDGKSESGSVNPPGTASEDQLQIGTKKEPTGEDPAVETSSAKAEKEDSTGSCLGTTTHPARTNNSELDQYKYASMSDSELIALCNSLGHSVLAGLANYQKSAAYSPENQSSRHQQVSPDLAGQAGWELAGLLSGDFDKQAADQLVEYTLGEIIKTASEDADKTAEFFHAYYSEYNKQAAEMAAGIDPAMMGGDEPMPGGPEGGPDEAAMLAAMSGGDEMGGALPEDAEMGGMGGDDELAELQEILEALNISPEELQQAMEAEGEGGMMDEPMPEDELMDAPAGMEVEASARRQSKKANVKKVSADEATRSYIQEVLERSRR